MPMTTKANATLMEVCRAAALAAHAGAGVAAKHPGALEVARLLRCAEAMARSAGAVAASHGRLDPGEAQPGAHGPSQTADGRAEAATGKGLI